MRSRERTRTASAPQRRSSPDLALVGDEDDDGALAALEADLDLTGARPEDALRSQPTLFYRAAVREARLRARLDLDERQLALTEARVESDIRNAQEGRDDPLGDDAVAARVRVSADVEAARKKAGASRRKALLAEMLTRAYEQRERALLALIRK